MSDNHRDFLGNFETSMFEGGDVVSQVLNYWLSGTVSSSAHAYINGAEDIITASAHAYVPVRQSVETMRGLLGEERLTSNLFDKSSITTQISEPWFFGYPVTVAHAYIEGVEAGLVTASAHAYIKGREQIIFPHLLLGDQDGRISTSNVMLTGGEAAHALSNFAFDILENTAHAYIFSVGYVTESAHAYLNAVMRAAAHAYIRGGIVVTQDAPAFIEGVAGIFTRATAHAFIQGGYTDLPGPAIWTT